MVLTLDEVRKIASFTRPPSRGARQLSDLRDAGCGMDSEAAPRFRAAEAAAAG